MSGQNAEESSAQEWLSTQQALIKTHLMLKHDWNSYQSPPPNETAAHWMNIIIQQMSEMNFIGGTINPSGEGGLAIVIRTGNRYSDIECLNDGDILAIIRQETSPSTCWKITPHESHIRADLKVIRSFMGLAPEERNAAGKVLRELVYLEDNQCYYKTPCLFQTDCPWDIKGAGTPESASTSGGPRSATYVDFQVLLSRHGFRCRLVKRFPDKAEPPAGYPVVKGAIGNY